MTHVKTNINELILIRNINERKLKVWLNGRI